MIDKILNYWNFRPIRLRNDISLAGSPERCATRVAVEDERGAVLVLERLLPGQAQRRAAIARILDELANNGLARSLRYIPDHSGVHVVHHRSDHYMLAPLIHGGPPPRPALVRHGWRGRGMAEFLLEMEAAASSVPENLVNELGAPLDLPAYVASLSETLRLRRPAEHARLSTSLKRLASFFDNWPCLPLRLSHGDFHPLNAVWSEDALTGVIDWEFMGRKPMLYDVANCVGCVGSEGPDALAADFVNGLIGTLNKAGWDLALLPETVAALRTGWLSEWLRRGDEDMIDLELAYMDLLTRNLDRLRIAWGAC